MSMSAKAPNPEKGKRYFGLLDQALCNGSWSEVPELARKTDKHAPERKCFTLTARTQAQIATASHRPTSASSSGESSIHSLGEAISKLNEAIASPTSSAEDAYCASACRAEIYWLQEDSDASLKALPRSIGASTSKTGLAPLGWLEVCEAKCTFLRTAGLEATGHEQDARAAYASAVAQTPGSRSPELRRWTERLLARACRYFSRRTSESGLNAINDSLRAFRAWANYWQRVPTAAVGSNSGSSRVDVPHRAVWKAYYDLLSLLLRRDIMYNSSASGNADMLIRASHDVPEDVYFKAKYRQYAEIKEVEMKYETLLLNETKFPKATESNTEIEVWIEQAVSNWAIFCGSGWTDSELGEGGKERASRSTLDILYRAAVKTFHSTAILRQLFHVHTALGEFDLAMHAFSSYEEIVGKAKARADKTGKHELGADGNDSALLTAAEAIRLLCRYGDREQAERALDVAKTISQWLGVPRPSTSSTAQTGDGEAEARPTPHMGDNSLSAHTLAIAHRALGIARAHWARLTYDTETRYGLQTQAVESLRTAYSYDESSIETSFALARVLAEMQQISAALEITKRLVASSSAVNEAGGDDINNGRWRRLVPVWHLLALCLTARDDYENAFVMCEAAFDQFGDANMLFGDNAGQMSNGLEKQHRKPSGPIDQLDSFEKEAVLQIKISQLTLVELMEGANVAVDSTDELLSLYARLFGRPEDAKPASKPPPTALSAAPSQGGGTLRSIVGSIRPKTARSSVEKETFKPGPETSTRDPVPTNSSDAYNSASNSQAFGAPISITVTNEDGVSSEKQQRHHEHHLHLPFKMRAHHGDFRTVGNLRSNASAENLRQANYDSNANEKAPAPPPKDTAVTDHAHKTADTPSVPPQQPLKHMQHDSSPDAYPLPVGHTDQPPEQDVRLPVPHAATNDSPIAHLAALQERQHKASLLVSVWLFTAGLYVRADHHDDASGAIREAAKMVETFEMEMGAANVNARGLSEKGWGGGRSVDELWAEVHVARGDLAIARERPFEAMSQYEQALSYFPDHPAGIIGVSNLLMDIYEEKMPAEPPKPLFDAVTPSSGLVADTTGPAMSRPSTAKSTLADVGRTAPPQPSHRDPTPAELNRLAARDRAYMLLSNLTRLGSGWDDSEAWYTLSRAYELSKQMDKAKQALWWVVELEDNKPMRPWNKITPGGYAL